MSGELKPCPFCGGEAEVVRKSTRVMVICPSAGPVCMTLRSESYGNDDAITAWNTRAPTACTPDHIEVANAIKATEYKYFGDYEMSDDQRHAVDVLVRFAQTYVTPSQGLDAATVERCAQVAESLRGDALYSPNQYGTAGKIADAIRALATDPHQHGGKGA